MCPYSPLELGHGCLAPATGRARSPRSRRARSSRTGRARTWRTAKPGHTTVTPTTKTSAGPSSRTGATTGARERTRSQTYAAARTRASVRAVRRRTCCARAARVVLGALCRSHLLCFVKVKHGWRLLPHAERQKARRPPRDSTPTYSTCSRLRSQNRTDIVIYFRVL